MDPLDIPKIRNWVDEWGDDVDEIDYLKFSGDLAVIVAYSRLLWPQLIEVERCILRDSVYEASNFRDWRSQFSSVRDVETTLNQIEVWEIVETEESDGEALAFLAKCIKDSWQAALHARFPGRNFHVWVRESEDGPIVTFCSTGPQSVEP